MTLTTSFDLSRLKMLPDVVVMPKGRVVPDVVRECIGLVWRLSHSCWCLGCLGWWFTLPPKIHGVLLFWAGYVLRAINLYRCSINCNPVGRNFRFILLINSLFNSRFYWFERLNITICCSCFGLGSCTCSSQFHWLRSCYNSWYSKRIFLYISAFEWRPRLWVVWYWF